MIRFVVLGLGIPLLAIGGEGLYLAARNLEQRVMTCEEFARERPEAAWLRLTNCDVDYIGAGYRESNGRMTELLFPIRPAGQPRDVPAVAVVATRDEGALGLADGTIGAGQQADQEAFLVMMLKIVTSLKASREVDGYARVGIVDAFNARRVVSGLAGPVDPSAVVIDLHAGPPRLVPAFQIAAGALAVLVFVFLQMAGRRRARHAAAEHVGAASMVLAPGVETAAPAAAPPRLRGLMLLNLPADAGVDAIEMAPPLGTRAEVVRTLEGTMPALQMDDSGRGMFKGPGCTIAVALGPSELVATAVLDAQGEGALAVIPALLAATGWRAYAPRRGAFVEAGQLRDLMEPLP